MTDQTLDKLTAGHDAVVIDVDGEVDVARRLLEMGLTPGTPVRLVRKAPFGDPIEILLRGYHLTLRRTEAGRVRVRA